MFYFALGCLIGWVIDDVIDAFKDNFLEKGGQIKPDFDLEKFWKQRIDDQCEKDKNSVVTSNSIVLNNSRDNEEQHKLIPCDPSGRCPESLLPSIKQICVTGQSCLTDETEKLLIEHLIKLVSVTGLTHLSDEDEKLLIKHLIKQYKDVGRFSVPTCNEVNEKEE